MWATLPAGPQVCSGLPSPGPRGWLGARDHFLLALPLCLTEGSCLGSLAQLLSSIHFLDSKMYCILGFAAVFSPILSVLMSLYIYIFKSIDIILVVCCERELTMHVIDLPCVCVSLGSCTTSRKTCSAPAHPSCGRSEVYRTRVFCVLLCAVCWLPRHLQPMRCLWMPPTHLAVCWRRAWGTGQDGNSCLWGTYVLWRTAGLGR